MVLEELFTAETAEAHTARGERFLAAVAGEIARHPLPVSVSGYGSMLTLHALPAPPADGVESARRDPALQELLFLGLYRRGVYMAPRGMINLSLPLTDAQLDAALAALEDTLADLSARLVSPAGERSVEPDERNVADE
jgi:glutamate-1-semialdehyde 2,1-aminomutase